MNPLFIILGLQILAYIICIYTFFYTRKKIIEKTYLHFKNRKVINPSADLFNTQLQIEESRVDIPPIFVLYVPIINIFGAGIVLMFVSGDLLLKLVDIIKNHFNHKVIQNFVKIQKIDPQYLPKEYVVIEKDNNINNKDAGKISIVDPSNTRGKVSLSSKE